MITLSILACFNFLIMFCRLILKVIGIQLRNYFENYFENYFKWRIDKYLSQGVMNSFEKFILRVLINERPGS